MSKRTRKFKTEVQQLLHLVVHSLYSKKEIFLRELISNASDAIDRAKFEALTDKDLLHGEEEWKIKIAHDDEARTITISDDGIGMTADDLEKNIGTIANSGTRKFIESMEAGESVDNLDLIGQFGVGFYSSFMVADKVTIITKRAGQDQEAVKWTSAGEGNYTIEESERASHGTEITLHIKEGMDEYLSEWRLREIVKQYSNYIAYPIAMDIVRTETPDSEAEGEPVETITEETLNSMQAIWKQNKKDVSDEDYNEFYKHISQDYNDPLKVVHFSAEGVTEFKALLYIPSKAPADLFWKEGHRGIHLYVRNVSIGEDIKELIPEYLRFVRGVVDSSDLPLNVSREMLQDDAIIARMRKGILGKILGALEEMKKDALDEYMKFYAEFGVLVKEGLYSDFENKKRLDELVAFPSTLSEEGKPVFLKDYVERMPQDQKEIYYITAEGLESAANSPLLEVFKAKGYEVLLMVDPIDEWVAERLTEYDGKKFSAVDRGEVDLDSETDKEKKEEKLEGAKEENKDLIEFLKKHLDEDVQEVRLSTRLTESVSCLVADEGGMTPNMERIMRAMNQDVPKSKRILELNPDHPVMATMRRIFQEDGGSERMGDYADLLYDQALLTEGSRVRDPSRFARLVSDLMTRV